MLAAASEMVKGMSRSPCKLLQQSRGIAPLDSGTQVAGRHNLHYLAGWDNGLMAGRLSSKRHKIRKEANLALGNIKVGALSLASNSFSPEPLGKPRGELISPASSLPLDQFD